MTDNIANFSTWSAIQSVQFYGDLEIT